MFKDAGFAEVKHWYQPNNHLLRNGEELFESPVTRSLREQEPAIQQAAKKIYNELSGSGTTDLKTMEVMIILAFKD